MPTMTMRARDFPASGQNGYVADIQRRVLWDEERTVRGGDF